MPCENIELMTFILQRITRLTRCLLRQRSVDESNRYILKHFLIFSFCPRVHQTQKLYQFINTGSSLLLPKRKYETNSATYISAYNVYIYILVAVVTLSQGLSLTLGDNSA